MEYHTTRHRRPSGGWNHVRESDYDAYNSHTSPYDKYRRSSGDRRGSDASDTYGTYIYDISSDTSKHYHTHDPTRCKCRCCPHPRQRSDSGSHPVKSTDGWHRRESEAQSRGYYPPGSSPYTRTRRSSSYDTDYQSDYKTDYLGHCRPKKSYACTPNGRNWGPMQGDYAHSRPAKGKHGPHHSSIIVDVVDRTASQRLRARYGKRFPLSISTGTTTARDVSLFLAPDQRRERVVVKWRDGEVEALDDLVPITDLGSQGVRLEVRARKNVHWS